MANPIIQVGGTFSDHFMEVTFFHLRLSAPHGPYEGGRTISYRDVNCVLVSPSHELTLQIGKHLFSIPIGPANPEHQKALSALLEALARN